jgi:hypothetical protein
MNYKEKQRKLQTAKLHYQYPTIFNNDKGYGDFDKYKSLMYVLRDGENNLYREIVNYTSTYFKDNDISWWGDNEKYPTGHLLSSQIQCLNYLFALRKDHDAVLELVQIFDSEIDSVLSTINDHDEGFIAFEFAYKNEELLEENDFGSKRGTKCTSIDAFIIAKRNKERILIPIEWKYTEKYTDGENKALEYEKGITRQNRYNRLIENSKQLIDSKNKAQSIYYYEPFYEFMRQTLLVEQMILKGLADDFIHIIVIPSENKDLLGNNYKFTANDLETTWRNAIVDQTKFKIIDSHNILQVIDNMPAYSKLTGYLKLRY